MAPASNQVYPRVRGWIVDVSPVGRSAARARSGELGASPGSRAEAG